MSGHQATAAEPDSRGISDGDMERLRDLERRQPAGVWRADFDVQRCEWSPELYTLYGEVPESFDPTFSNVISRMAPADAKLLTAQVEQWTETPEPVACSYRVIRPSGELRVMEIRGWVERDDSGRGSALLGTARDITPELLMRHARERLDRQQAMILHASGDGICGLDIEGRVTFCNPALKSLMRREGECLEGALLHDLLHRDSAGAETHPARECPFREPVAGPTSSTDTAFHRRDGSRIEVAYVIVRVDDSDFRGSVISFRDVTTRRAASRLLQTSLQQVQSLSAQRGALLKHLAEAEERERLRIAADIHDDTIQSLGAVGLRLGTAQGHLADGADPGEVLAAAERDVRDVAESLRGLMFELMAPASSEDLSAAITSYGEILFRETELRFGVVGEVGPLASERYLLAYRLIQEALRNAVKHSRGRRVEVVLETTDSELIVRVADDGVGMDETPGASAPPTHAGLRIIRQRAEAAGGTARFGVGLEGRGSAIEVRLPLAWSDTR